MVKYIFKRLLFSLLAMFILITIIYFAMSVLPYLPVEKDPKESIEDFNNRLHNLGLDKPILERYLNYIGGIFKNDFGLQYRKPTETIPELFFQNIPWTMYISGIAYIFSIIIGFFFGTISAIYRGKWQDTLVNILSVIFISVPSFIFAIILLQLAGVLNLPQSFIPPGSENFTVSNFILSSILPVIVLIFALASTLTYYIRNELVDVLSQDYIKTAMSKGLTFRQILFKHAYRNIMIPVLSILAPSLLNVISGSVVIEKFFAVRGIASILTSAVTSNEVNVIVFQALFFSGLYFLIQIILDISYIFIDPRIKLTEENDASLFSICKRVLRRFLWKKSWLNFSNKYYVIIDTNSDFYKKIFSEKKIDFKKKKIHVSSEEFKLNGYNDVNSDTVVIIDKQQLKLAKEI